MIARMEPLDFGVPLDFQRIVREGTWVFPGEEPAPVFVIEQNLVYYVLFNRPVERPWYVESPGFGSVQEAMEWAAEIVTGPIAWRDG